MHPFADMSEASGLRAGVSLARGLTRVALPAVVVSAGNGVTQAGGVRGSAAGHAFSNQETSRV